SRTRCASISRQTSKARSGYADLPTPSSTFEGCFRLLPTPAQCPVKRYLVVELLLFHTDQVQLAVEGIALGRNHLEVGRLTGFEQQVGIFDAELCRAYPLLGYVQLLIELVDHHERVGYFVHRIHHRILEPDFSLIPLQFGYLMLGFEPPAVEYRLRKTTGQPTKQRPRYVEPVLRQHGIE